MFRIQLQKKLSLLMVLSLLLTAFTVGVSAQTVRKAEPVTLTEFDSNETTKVRGGNQQEVTDNVSGGEGVVLGQMENDYFWAFDKTDSSLTIAGSGNLSIPVNSWGGASEEVAWEPYRKEIRKVFLSADVRSYTAVRRPGGIIPRTGVELPIDELPRVCCLNRITDLESIEVDAENPYFSSVDGVLYNKDGTTLLLYPRGKAGTEFTVPEGVREIGEYAFACNSTLKKINLPKDLAQIDPYAFAWCVAIDSIKLPENMTVLAEGVLKGCAALTDIEFFDGITEIPMSFFSDCVSLKHPEIPASVRSIGYAAFSGCTGLTTIRLPDGMTEISDSVFSGCTGLTEVDIPDGIDAIGNNAFSGCTGLTEIALPDSLRSVGGYAFAGCTGLAEIDLPDSVEAIGARAFSDCAALKSIQLPTGLRTLENGVFERCTALKSVSVSAGLTGISASAFAGCDGIEKFEVDAKNANYSSDENGCLYNKQKTTLVRYPLGATAASFSVPDGVTDIGEYAFYNCKKLTTVSMPESVENLDRYSFARMEAMESLEIPESVTKLGGGVFADCGKLSEVSIPDSVQTIDYAAFSGCGSLESVVIPSGVKNLGSEVFYGCGKLAEVTVPDSVTVIGYAAFSDCGSLERVMIPAGVTTIDYSAFNECDSLRDVYYSGGETQWNAIEISDENTCLTAAAIHYNWNGAMPPITTEAPTTEAPTTEAPTTEAPTTEAPATEPDKEISSKDTEKAMVSAGKKQVSVLPGATADELKALLGGGVTIADKDGNETEPGKKVGTGAIVKTADGAEYTVVVPGDTDGDGKVGAGDARKALRASAKLDTLDGAFGSAADVNGDAKVKAADARTILRVAAKLDSVTGKTLAAVAA